MARRKHHEEHVNHEAWAIPYGDLITLLLAFFVVMYAVSSVNEGKYRVLSDSLLSAFKGAPRSLSPIQIGEQVMRAPRDGTRAGMDPMQAQAIPGQHQPAGEDGRQSAEMRAMAEDLEAAMDELIAADMVSVNRDGGWVEVEIKTDILFPSASAAIGSDAEQILEDLSQVLAPLENTIRVEGHTDDRPIATDQFPSNWELSAARAARIVRAFERAGIDSARMIAAGMGAHHPVADNGTAEGRARNRRVALVILDAGAEAADSERRSLGGAGAGRAPPAAPPAVTVGATGGDGP